MNYSTYFLSNHNNNKLYYFKRFRILIGLSSKDILLRMQISLLMHIINIIEKNYSFIKEKYYLASTSNRKMLLKIIK